MYQKYPILVIATLLLAACKLPGSDGLKSELPDGSDAPLNVVIDITYTGENYISQSFIKPGIITVAECESAEEEKTTEQGAQESKEKETKTDKKTVVQVSGYTYGYGKIKDETTKVSHLLFIPESSGNESSPLKPDTDYCVVVGDVEDTKGKPITGIAQGFQFHTQQDEEREDYFRFQTSLDKNYDFEETAADEEGSQACSFSSVPLVGKKSDDAIDLDSKSFVAFYTSIAIKPKDISAGTSLCKMPASGTITSENKDCGGWTSLNPDQAYLVETFRKDEDGWTRARFNTYSFGATYEVDATYKWSLGIKQGARNNELSICNDSIFQGTGKSSEPSPSDRIQTLNQLFDAAGAGKEKLKEGERIFFIPIVNS